MDSFYVVFMNFLKLQIGRLVASVNLRTDIKSLRLHQKYLYLCQWWKQSSIVVS